MAKDWMSKLVKFDGAVKDRKDVHLDVLDTSSPSLNFLFGNGWGLPKGFSMIVYGPPKSGKSVIGFDMAGRIHKNRPNDWVLRFDTEYRDHGQLGVKQAAAYGIDLNRYMAFETNHPEEIYNQCDTKLRAMLADGFPLGVLILDSTNGVKGIRSLTNEKGAINNAIQMGDVARTNKEGLKVVLDLQRKYNFGVYMTSHVAVELDQAEQMRGNKFKMGASVGVQHHAEYFVFVEAVRGKAGITNAQGAQLVDTERGDMSGRNFDQLGHKVRVVMKDSSMGPKGRTGMFTYADNLGIINQHEEVYLLGVNRGIIVHPKTAEGKENVRMNEIRGYPQPPILGKDAFIDWLSKSPEAQEFVIKELKRQDLDGSAKGFDALDEVNAYHAEDMADEDQTEEVTE